jgi:tetratricopeptide (TPR) repeat protein
MKRLTKQELRHDPFLETLEKLTGVMKAHGNKVLWGAVIVFGAIVAIVIYTSQNRQGASEAEWKFLQAISLYSQGDTAQSVPIFDELMDVYGGTLPGKKAGYYLGIHALKQRDLDVSEEFFKSYLASKPRDPFLEMSAHGCLASIALDKDRLDEALMLFERAEAISPYQTYKAYYAYKAALAARMSGRYDDAIRHLEKFEDEYKDSPFRTSARKELSFVKGAMVIERG